MNVDTKWLIGIAIVLSFMCKRNIEADFEAGAHIWPQLPLTVYVDPEIDDDDAHAALKFWKREVGCPMFMRTDNMEAATVRIINGNPTDGGDCEKRCSLTEHAACTCQRRIGVRVTGVDVYVLDPMEAYLTLVHEGCHIFGLAHDLDSRMSVCRPDVRKAAREGQMILLKSNDRKAMRERYCSR